MMKTFAMRLAVMAAVGVIGAAYAGLRAEPRADQPAASLAPTAAPAADSKPVDKAGCCASKADAKTAAKGCCCAAKADAPKTEAVKADAPKADAKPATKEETLTGTMACAKCGLKMAGVKKCTNALSVKVGDKTVVYLLDDKGNGEDYHEGLCGGGTKENAKVTGTVSEKDGQKQIKPSKVETK